MSSKKRLIKERFIIGNVASKEEMLTTLNRLVTGRIVSMRVINSIRRIINNVKE